MTQNYGIRPLTPMTEFESFCKCAKNCSCGERNIHEWTWDENLGEITYRLSEDNREVKFHPSYSSGTAAIRGNKPMVKGRHHYWEVKMVSPIYGTDVMVGVGTKKAQLIALNKFMSLLGADNESWGLSYKGIIHHAGEMRHYSPRFGQGSIVGVHVDTWRGTLQFFINRKPHGIAFTGLHDVELYPMVCSTSAKTKMRIAQSLSMSASLQMDCLAVLKPLHRSYLSAAFPGLRYLFDSIFAEILRNNRDDEEIDEDFEFHFPEEYMILDDFDFALIGYGRRKKKKRMPQLTDVKCIKLS